MLWAGLGREERLPRSTELGLCQVLGDSRGLGAPSGSACAPSSSHLQEYAGEGLRTLVLAYKDLEESYYEDWSERLHRAGSAPEAREDYLARLYDEVEHDMMVRGLGALGAGGDWGAAPADLPPVWVPQLLGATAIEDKLQQGVPETIAILTLANIKIWVLTGDKQGEALLG